MPGGIIPDDAKPDGKMLNKITSGCGIRLKK